MGFAGIRDFESKPWSDCTREVKLQGFLKLPKLLTQIVENVEAEIREAEKVSATVTKLVQSIQQKGG